MVSGKAPSGFLQINWHFFHRFNFIGDLLSHCRFDKSSRTICSARLSEIWPTRNLAWAGLSCVSECAPALVEFVGPGILAWVGLGCISACAPALCLIWSLLFWREPAGWVMIPLSLLQKRPQLPSNLYKWNCCERWSILLPWVCWWLHWSTRWVILEPIGSNFWVFASTKVF